MKTMSKPLTCETAMRLASERHDGMIVNEASLNDHLDTCPNCRRFAASMEWTEKEIRQPLPAPHTDLVEKALMRANAEQRGGIPPIAMPWLRYALPLAGGVIAGLVWLSVHHPPVQHTVETHPVILQPLPSPVVPVIPHGTKQAVTIKRVVSVPHHGVSQKHYVVLRTIRKHRDFPVVAPAPRSVAIEKISKEIDDLDVINTSPATALMHWIPTSGQSEQIAFENRLRQIARHGDDFIAVPFPRLASLNSNRAIIDAEAQYRREAAIVDPRLQRAIALSVEGDSFAEFCRMLTHRTGIEFSADPTVADDPLILLCHERTLRDIMRQISHHFGFTWRRDGEPGQYRYVLVQEVTAQLMEEELRNRDRNEAILAIDTEMQQYRPLLSLTPDEALNEARRDRQHYLQIARTINTLEANRKPVPSSLRKQLEEASIRTTGEGRYNQLNQLRGMGWAPIHLYFQLTAEQHETLRRGETLRFSSLPADGELPMPPEIEPLLRSALRDCHLTIGPNGDFYGTDGNEASFDDYLYDRPVPPLPSNKYTLLNAPSGASYVSASLKMKQKEEGVFELEGDSGFGHIKEGKSAGSLTMGRSLATGKGSSQQDDNRVLTQHIVRYPDLQKMVVKLTLPESVSFFPVPLTVRKPDEIQPGPWPMQSVKDVLKGIHSATGEDILADGFEQLVPSGDLEMPATEPLKTLLQRTGEVYHLRWRIEEGETKNRWLLARGRTFFNDRLTQIPPSLFSDWSAHRREKGYLSLTDLAAISQLSEAQLDSEQNGKIANARYDLREWELVSGKNYRAFWRFYNRLNSEQQAHLWSDTGLTVSELSPEMEGAFMQMVHGQGAEQISAYQRDLYRKSGRLQGKYITIPAAEKALVAGKTGEYGSRIQPTVRVTFQWGEPGKANGFQLVTGM